MDTIEATKMVMSRIQKLDPENASKIMGYILIQDQGENEMIRLAFGPESHLVSVIKQAKTFLDISSNTSSAPSTPSLFTHRNLNSPQIIIPNNGFHHMNPPSPSSPWSLSGSFSDHHPHRGSPRPISYSSVVNGGRSSASSFYNNFNDHTEEYSPNNGPQVGPDQLSLFDESKNVDFIDNCNDLHPHHLHRRSCSVNDVFLGGGGGNDDIGGGWRPCMYFARGFCKNGTSCNFAHGNGGFGEELGLGSSSPTTLAGSPNGKIDAFEDLLRIKAIQQQQQRIAAMSGGGAPPFPFNRCMNFLNENPRLTIGDEFHKFGRRNDFLSFGNSNSSSRQIYLTFPADSTFKEEDVSNYFSMFGPVQDVRIPYQQKRMFGFVTFMLPETVKAILAKGNPHFVCDSRVLVKPYKEKGKIPDKKHQQQIERGDFSGCLSPTALESAEPFDHIPFGARMFNHEMILRRKLEERVELQHAIEFQDRRLMNLQLTEIKNNQFQSNLSVSSPVSDGNNEEVISGAKNNIEDGTNSPNDESDSNMQPEIKNDDENNGGNGSEKDLKSNQNESDKHESFEHNLPDNLFASPTKSAATNHQTIFPINVPENDGGAATNHPPPASSTAIDMRASINSCTFKCQAIDM